MGILKVLTHSNGFSRIIFGNRVSGVAKHISRMAKPLSQQSTIDKKDVEHLNQFKNIWWDKSKIMNVLHAFVPIRIQFVKDGLANTGFKEQNPVLPLEGVKIADVGCGGGILTEPLARIGAQVTGIDVSMELLDIAKEHVKLDPNILEKINYVYSTIEEFSEINQEQYDVVISSEVIEHVANPELFLKGCINILKPGGSFFLTTENKTLSSWFGAIVLAEYILNIIPRGTHQWNKFITPYEIQRILDNYGCNTKLIHGLIYNPMNNQWSWSSFKGITYALHAVKQKI